MRYTVIFAVIALVASLAAAQGASSPMATAPICAMPRAIQGSDGKVLRSLLPMRPESGHYELTGRVINVGGNRYTGWVQQGNQSGRVTLIQHGNRLTVTVTSRQGSARLTLARG